MSDSKLADIRLENVKILMGMQGLSDNAKANLIKLAMDHESWKESISDCVITEIGDNLYQLERPKWKSQFRVVISNGKVLQPFHGVTVEELAESIDTSYWDEGRKTKRVVFSKTNRSYVTYHYDVNGSVKEQTVDSFEDFPNGDGSNIDKFTLEDFKNWLLPRIVARLQDNKQEPIYLEAYGFTRHSYKPHLDWIEKLCNAKGYILSDEKITFPTGISPVNPLSF